jgi:hypothetical protein
VKSALAWLEARGSGAPAALLERASHYVVQAGEGPDPAQVLARAGVAALEATLGSGSGRAAALDLLAADALVSLALLVQAELDPASLAGFARRVRHTGAAVS